MNCPLCVDQTLDITHRNGIELDICPKCHGIWLDRGEIDRLIAEDAPAPERSPARDARDRTRSRDDGDRDRDRDKKRKKKKSLASRIGDAIEDAIDELT